MMATTALATPVAAVAPRAVRARAPARKLTVRPRTRSARSVLRAPGTDRDPFPLPDAASTDAPVKTKP